MDVSSIVAELKSERDRIESAIRSLEAITGIKKDGRGRKPGRHMSAEARARIGAAMRKRWAERKRKQKAA